MERSGAKEPRGQEARNHAERDCKEKTGHGFHDHPRNRTAHTDALVHGSGGSGSADSLRPRPRSASDVYCGAPSHEDRKMKKTAPMMHRQAQK